ncbi:MAG: hypothetical protein ACRDQA_07580 [Nocardioidaceae bacterium]
MAARLVGVPFEESHGVRSSRSPVALLSWSRRVEGDEYPENDHADDPDPDERQDRDEAALKAAAYVGGDPS